MADNTTLNAGTGGDVIATDDVGGVKYQVVKLDVGADGVAAPVSNSNPIPISDASSSITVDNAGLTELAAAINASSQVDVNIAASNASVAVTNAGITTIAGAVSGTEMQVDVLTMPTTTVVGAAAEDAAASGNPVLIGGRYDSSARALETGDVGALALNASGQAQVEVVSITGSQTDDAAFTAASGIVSVIAGIVTADSVDSGDAGAVAMTTARALHTAVQSLPASTNTLEVVGDAAHDAAAAGNPLLVGAYASAAAPSDVSGDADAVRIWALRNGSLVVNQAIGGTLVTATTTREVVGDAADDAATAGNPVLIGGVAVETDGTDPTTVSAEGDAAYLRTDRARRLLVSEHHPRSFFTSADYGSAQTNASVQAAPGAGLSLYITDIVISNGATAGNITLLDGSGGTVKFEIYPAINGGCTISLRQPIRLTANTALCITSTTVTTHSVNIGGYIAP